MKTVKLDKVGNTSVRTPDIASLHTLSTNSQFLDFRCTSAVRSNYNLYPVLYPNKAWQLSQEQGRMICRVSRSCVVLSRCTGVRRGVHVLQPGSSYYTLYFVGLRLLFYFLEYICHIQLILRQEIVYFIINTDQ